MKRQGSFTPLTLPRLFRGVSLIEFLLVLSIGSAMAVGVWGWYRGQQSQYWATQMHRGVLDIVDMADEAVSTSLRFVINDTVLGPVPLTMDRVIDATQSTPPALVFSERLNAWTHAWGGTWTVGVASTDCTMGCTEDLLVQTLNNVPADGCIQLVNMLAAKMFESYVDGELVALAPPPTTISPGRNATRPEQVAVLCGGEGRSTLEFRSFKMLDMQHMNSLPADALINRETELNRINDAIDAREDALAALD